MQIQRLRNLTTGRLHTQVNDIYEDIEFLIGEKGVMTHMLGDACKALLPFLKEQTENHKILWDGEYNPNQDGEIDIRPLNDDEKKIFWGSYGK